MVVGVLVLVLGLVFGLWFESVLVLVDCVVARLVAVWILSRWWGRLPLLGLGQTAAVLRQVHHIVLVPDETSGGVIKCLHAVSLQ